MRTGHRLGLAAFVALGIAALTCGPASAEVRLAVGAAGGFQIPEGARVMPVYTWPRGHRWVPADTDFGHSFREPIYTTPRGYRYIYVRGYRMIHIERGKKRVGCVTELGFGRYETCR